MSLIPLFTDAELFGASKTRCAGWGLPMSGIGFVTPRSKRSPLNFCKLMGSPTGVSQWKNDVNRRRWLRETKGGSMKKILRLVFLLAMGGGFNTAEAQPLPARVGYTALAGSFTPLWMAKELDLFERQGIQCSPIYMASTIAWQAMLAGETDFTVGAPVPAVQARVGGADPLIVVTYISGFTFSVMA